MKFPPLIRIACAAASTSLMLLIAQSTEAEEEAATEVPYTTLPYSPSLDTASMDRTVDPCEDLYTFSCGGWQKSNPVPADQSSWSVYGKLTADNQRYLWGILESAAETTPDRTPTQQKIGDYFAACMDESSIERVGTEPVRRDLALIDTMPDKRSLAAVLGQFHVRGTNGGGLFASGSQQDANNSTKVIAAIYAGGLGLPDRDYYTKSDAKSVEIRERYVAHIAKMFELVGERRDNAAAHARTVMRLETALASASLTQVEKRDPYKTYHRFTPEALRKLAPDFYWSAYFHATRLNAAPWLNVAEPAFFQELNARIVSESLADLQAYLRWTVVDAAAPYLSKALVAENFAFYRGYLRGVEQDQPRWKKCVNLVDDQLSEALGKEFVARAFPEATRQKTLKMTQQIEAAMKKRIESLEWMSPATRKQGLAKLAAMRNKIGYPDLWRDYSGLVILRSDFFGNVRRGTEFESFRQAAKVGKPVDRGEWGMSAPTVNAYYDPQMNDINFPAGVLMPPLYDPLVDDAPNYGNTGGTIGHELTHGFDDEGRQYDGAGNLRDWWTKSDAKNFEQRAQCIRDQYSQYTIVDDIKINGALTSGEDIADLGGELLAWMAWQEQTREMKLEPEDDLTPEQRFFVGFAQWACTNDRPEQLRMNAVVDPHSPPRYRINGTVSNMPEFAQAFQCKEGSALVKKPKDVCKVW